MEQKVILSVAADFVATDDDPDFDLWIVESVANQSLAAELRGGQRFRSVTVFKDLGDRTANVHSMLPTIFEHHPSASFVLVRGLSPEEGKSAIHDSPSGWVGSLGEREVVLQKSS